MATKRKKRIKNRHLHTRNPRVRRVSANEWIVGREAKLKVSLRFAAAAKSYRTAVGVTQTEMAKSYGMASIANWESGFYFGWNALELSSYCRRCDRVAGVKNGIKKAAA